ncbi:NAD(P)H-quinone oxidoreductase [Smaragdicoccus niigatensis]|uniref:NAD(P)H-quinone oxidoreductase n=1 Tax=Smaragdicoccus niigatensis TaxID=359359 RepID=UPI000377BED4|nr:NAD(P)H-quinone oxidoreductase [Smaragdicoccus niigatensis]
MRAMTMSAPGGPEVLQWTEVSTPTVGDGQVRIDVAATAVNRADLLQRQGFYPPPPGASDIIGLECSGTVSEIGPGVDQWRIGDEVCALLAGGGYAEQVVVDARHVLPKPAGISLVSAASLPETACTVWSNLLMRAGLHAGQHVLIHGGSSGIGTHAIQICRALGATVAVTAGSTEKLDACAELGAEILVNYRTEDFAELVRADLILDIMGAKYLAQNIRALQPDGQLVIIGMQGGISAELPIAELLGKRGTVHATNLRGRPADNKAAIVAAVREHVWPLIADGTVRPVVYAELPITEAPEAHRMLDSGSVIGKVVLVVGAEAGEPVR